MAESEEEAKQLGDLYHDLRGVQRALELAWAFAQVETHQDSFEPRKVHLFNQLAGHLMYPAFLENSSHASMKNRWSQSMLWRFGISGDFPIVLCHIQNASDMEVFRDLLDSQEYLMKRGLTWDLVMLNEFPGSYFDTLQEELQGILANRDPQVAKHAFVLRRASLSEEDIVLLTSVSALEWDAKKWSIRNAAAALGAARQVFCIVVTRVEHSKEEANRCRFARKGKRCML